MRVKDSGECDGCCVYIYSRSRWKLAKKCCPPGCVCPRETKSLRSVVGALFLTVCEGSDCANDSCSYKYTDNGWEIEEECPYPARCRCPSPADERIRAGSVLILPCKPGRKPAKKSSRKSKG